MCIVLDGLDEQRVLSGSAGLPFLPDWVGSRGLGHRRSELLLLLELREL